MRELGRYKVTVMVTVDLVAFSSDEAYRDAIEMAQCAIDESGMDSLRVTGIARDSDGSDMVYCYTKIAVESLI